MFFSHAHDDLLRMAEQWKEDRRKEEIEYQEHQKEEIQRYAVEHHIGRNDPCPCGSGKKYKKCHG